MLICRFRKKGRKGGGEENWGTGKKKGRKRGEKTLYTLLPPPIFFIKICVFKSFAQFCVFGIFKIFAEEKKKWGKEEEERGKEGKKQPTLREAKRRLFFFLQKSP